MLTKENIEKYFNAEKAESFVFMAIGIIAIAIAVYFWLSQKPALYKGMAYPLVAVGLLLAVVGGTVALRANTHRIRNVYAFDMNPQELKEKELPRMQKVMRAFVVYRYIEIALIIIGIAMYFFLTGSATLKGVGLGLIIMASAALAADFFAEKRGHIYYNNLTAFTKV
jgi:MFS family permease